MTDQQQAQAAAARKVRDVRVQVTTTGDPSDPYEVKWKGLIFWNSPPIPTTKGSNVDLHFELHDKAGTGATLASPVTAAFGAHADLQTSPAPGSDGGGEIDFANSSVSEKTMVVRDLNMNAGDLNFALFFSDGTKLDPIIRNTGGGTGG